MKADAIANEIRRSPIRIKLEKSRDFIMERQKQYKQIEDSIAAIADRKDVLIHALESTIAQIAGQRSRMESLDPEDEDAVAALQEEVLRSREEIRSLEKELNHMSTDSAAYDKQLRAVRLDAAKAKQTFDQLKADYEEESKSRKEELEQQRTRVKNLEASVDAGLMAEYLSIKKHTTPPVVRLQVHEIVGDIIVVTENPVAGAEAHLVGQVIDIDGIALVAEIGIPPDVQDQDVREDGEEEIVQHAAGHHQEALPGRMGAELPGLGILLHGFGVQGLVDHPGDLAIAAERQPADAVFGFPGGGLREQLREPGRLRGKQFRPADIEEQEELVHPDMEQLGPQEMTELMDEDEHGKGQDDLEGLDENYHIRLRAWAKASSFVAKISSSVGSATNSVQARVSAATDAMS